MPAVRLSFNLANGSLEFSVPEKPPKKQRKQKGHSLIENPENYVAIDIETTGLDPGFCEIIEIAALRYSKGVLVDSFTTLVKPTEPLDEFIVECTGITDEMLADAPPIETAIKSFYDFVGNDILLGYNVSFDINFLYDNLMECHGIPFQNSFIDAMRFARKLLPDLRSHKLFTVSRHLKVSKPAHRAMADCIATHEVYQALLAEANRQYGTFEDFAATFVRHRYRGQTLRAKDISATTDSFDESHPLYGKLCVFTGVLEKMPRKEAMQLVVNLGGKCGDSVTKNTNYLILGNNDFCKTIKDGKSSKQKKAEAMILKGGDIEIISENVFYDMVLEQ